MAFTPKSRNCVNTLFPLLKFGDSGFQHVSKFNYLRQIMTSNFTYDSDMQREFR